MKVGMALKRAKVKLRQPSQQEATEKFKFPYYFKHRERRLWRFKEIITNAIPTFKLAHSLKVKGKIHPPMYTFEVP